MKRHQTRYAFLIVSSILAANALVAYFILRPGIVS